MTKDRARKKAEQYLEWAEKAEAKAKSLQDNFDKIYGDFDWTQPVLLGHYSQRKHERVFETRNSVFSQIAELEKKAKRHREKAENLQAFADRNKGDAEKARQEQRDLSDELYTVGSRVYDWSFGSGTILKVNKKTYRIKFDKGFTDTRDKSFIKI